MTARGGERRADRPCQEAGFRYPLDVREEGSSRRPPSVCVAETLSGRRGLVDLWCYFPERSGDAALRAAQAALMTPDEQARCRRFHFERDRRMFAATRALVRAVLSRYAAVGPGEWRFAAGPHGKPRIAHPAVTPALYFNLAHTPGLVVCAVSVAHESVGADVERLDRRMEILDLADRYFSGSEVRALRALPSSGRLRRFVALWTLKESYLKARGVGLTQPLHQFSFLLDREEIGVAFEEGQQDDAARWRFALLDSPPRHLIAVGADTGGAALSLRAARIVPLRGTGSQE